MRDQNNDVGAIRASAGSTGTAGVTKRDRVGWVRVDVGGGGMGA